jgi:hypothetical protein
MLRDTLDNGESLETYGTLESKSGKVSLRLQDKENFVLYANDRRV